MTRAEPLSAADVREQREGCLRRLTEHLAEWQVLERSAPEILARSARDADAEEARRLAVTRTTVEDARRRAAERRVLIERSAITQLGAVVEELASGAASAPWGSPDWQHLTHRLGAGAGGVVRVGSVVATDASVPVVLPLLGTPGWLVDTDEATFAGLVRGTVLRLFATLGPFAVRVVTYDPSLSTGVGAFTRLRQAEPKALRPSLTTTEAFESALVGVLEEVAATGDDLAAQGFATLLDAAAVRGRPPRPFHVIVVGGGVEDLLPTLRQRLVQLAAHGAPRGVSMLVRGRGSDDLLIRPASMLHVVTAGRTATCPPLGDQPWTLDPAPSPDLVRTVVDQVAGWEAAAPPVIAFSGLLETLDRRWLDPGDEGVAALIGTSDGRPLTIELRSENPPMPNVLIGGAVGQGKSNLLLVLIHALAAQYAPTELEMVLLDFRDGVEFAPLGPGPGRPEWLPHAVILGLECDRDFGLAVLTDLSDELHRRTALFKQAGVGKINDYRRRTGRTLPRRLVVIDEFQRLIDGDDDTADACIRLLDDLARTGRAAGFHLVLASQTISGIRGLAARADAIFGQFHHRISLRNTPAESAAILSPGNTAAAELRQRGEVVVNQELGATDANRRGLVAAADPVQLAELRRELWVSAPPERPPLVFRTSVPQPWTSAVTDAARATGPLTLVAGAPISVRERLRACQLHRGGDQAVVLLGSDPEATGPTLAALVLGALVSTPALAVVVLDGLSTRPVPHPVVTRLQEVLRPAVELTRVVAADVGPYLTSRAIERVPTAHRLVVTLGLDGISGLDDPDPESFATPLDALRDLVTTGPRDGTFVVGWWRSRRSCERQLGFDAPGVRAWALCGASRDDVQTVCGPLAVPPVGHPRLLWCDRGAAQTEPLIPFDLGTPRWGAP